MKTWLLVITLIFLQQILMAQNAYPSPNGPGNEPMASSKFEPNWQSLKQYEAPE